MSSEGDAVGGPPEPGGTPDGPRGPRERRTPGPHGGGLRHRRRILLALAVLGVTGLVGAGAAAAGSGGAEPVHAEARRPASPTGEALREVT
ncbi:hypothetical protein ACFV0Q_21095, partial [Streptomyces sp. NPDC059564]